MFEGSSTDDSGEDGIKIAFKQGFRTPHLSQRWRVSDESENKVEKIPLAGILLKRMIIHFVSCGAAFRC